MSEVLKFQHPEVSAVLVNARLAAIATLLALPDDIPDPLESELYAYRDIITGAHPHLSPEKPPQ